MKHFIFYTITIGFLVGITITSFINISFGWVVIISAVCGSYVLQCLFTRRFYKNEEKKIVTKKFIATLFVLTICCGMIRYYIFTQEHGDVILSEKINQKISAKGIVVEEPDERDDKTYLIVKISALEDSQLKDTFLLTDPTKIKINISPFTEVAYGDEVTVSGTLTEPENFQTDIGTEFNYKKFLEKDKIFYLIDRATISVRDHRKGNIVLEKLFNIKSFFISKLDEIIPYPESRFAAGLTVAGKRALPQDVLNDFQNSGTLQVVVLSGYNINIIATAIAYLFSFLPIIYSSSLSIISIILFTLMTGATATIVRASVMATIAVIGRLSKRNYDVLRALTISALIMLLFNPMLLMFDPSFQLSFLATIGLILFSKPINNRLKFIPEKFNIREIIASTCAAEVMVIPYLLFSSHTLSLVSFPANALLAFLVPITMLMCFTTGLTAFFSRILALPQGFVSSLLLQKELTLIHFFASIPFAMVTLPYYPWWFMLGTYCCYGVLLWRKKLFFTKNP